MPHPESDALIGMLPHRPPFRFIDVVDAITMAEHIEARDFVTGDEYFLQGHFPGNPIVPGVIQLEALAQAGVLTLLGDDRYAGSSHSSVASRRCASGALSVRATRRSRGRRRALERTRWLGAGARQSRVTRRARRGMFFAVT